MTKSRAADMTGLDRSEETAILAARARNLID